jgi:NAD(P)-dependent dehydrogenase (short-subunit alcohol dehydrogenase family)
MADINFKGKVAIVTGAGAGLGKTYAIELAKRGCKVVVNDLGGARDGSGASHGPAQDVVDEIKKAGGEAAPNYDNVATIEGGQGIVKTAVDAFGKVDIVINNAGILRDKSFLKMEPEIWDLVIAVHLRGAYCVTQPAFAIMKEQNYGRVVLTTSGAGLYGNFGQTNYAAAKMGLIGLMNALKIEGAKYNVKVNTIAPVAASRLTEDVMPPEFFAKLKPEFITPLVTYLASEENQDSGYIFNCGMGWYSRSAIVMGGGALIGDGNRDIKAEEIRDSWKKITDISGAKEVGSVQETFGAMLPLIQK